MVIKEILLLFLPLSLVLCILCWSGFLRKLSVKLCGDSASMSLMSFSILCSQWLTVLMESHHLYYKLHLSVQHLNIKTTCLILCSPPDYCKWSGIYIMSGTRMLGGDHWGHVGCRDRATVDWSWSVVPWEYSIKLGSGKFLYIAWGDTDLLRQTFCNIVLYLKLDISTILFIKWLEMTENVQYPSK